MTLNQWRSIALILLAIFTSAVITVADLPIVMATNTSIYEKNSSLSQNSIAQILSTSQLKDVKPTDPYFTALQSLIERYGAYAGFPDGTFRPNRLAFRAELAASLNTLLDKFNVLMSAGLDDIAEQKELISAKKQLTDIQSQVAAIKRAK